MGAQLERMRYGVHSTPDPHRARAEAEDHMMKQAAMLRCIEDFKSRNEFHVPARGPAAGGGGYKILEKLQKHSRIGQGALAYGILQAYHERVTCSNTQSTIRGLVEVYQFIARIAPDGVPRPPKTDVDLVQAFRTDVAKRACSMAAEAYADSLLALRQFVEIYNKKDHRRCAWSA